MSPSVQADGLLEMMVSEGLASGKLNPSFQVVMQCL